MTVGDLIQFIAPTQLDYFMRHLSHCWYEPACLNQETICQKLNIHIDHLQAIFEQYDEFTENL